MTRVTWTIVDHHDPGVRAALFAADAAVLPATVTAWQPAKDIAARRGKDLAEQFSWCTDESVAAIRARALRLARPEDYLQRVIEVDGLMALVGIRFVGGDREQPFVELIALARTDGRDAAPEAAALRSMVGAAIDSHAVFRPTMARLWRSTAVGEAPDACPPALGDGPDLRPRMDQVLVAGPPSDMTEHGPTADGIALVDASADAAMAFLERQYAAFREREPELSQRVPPADLEDFAGCRTAGRLAWWTVDGRVAGLIGVERRPYAGLNGWLVIEEVVDAAYVGRGTAASAQRRLADWLRGDEAGDVAAGRGRPVVHGTIDGANNASRRTAERAGRCTLGAWWFIESGE
ncbi:MAG: hypothetical protein AB8G96_17345 [Phycisphaerales bacterium]